VFESNRCSWDMKTCHKETTINLKDICSKLQDKYAFYSEFLSSFNPKLECPIKAGNYTKDKSELDLSLLALLPLDGYMFMANIKLIASNKESKVKKIALCMNVEAKVSKIRMKV
jgi:hypothetical protein